MEVWKDIKGYEGMYQISNHGRVKGLERWTHFKNGKKPRLEKEALRKFTVHHKGYFKVMLRKDDKPKGFFVHRLVAEAFIPNPENKEQVNHKDGDKQNNHVDNLEWMTRSENLKHSYNVLGSHRRAIEAMREPRIAAKIIPIKVYDKKGNFFKEYPSIREAAKELGVPNGSISAIAKRQYGFKSAGGYVFRYKNDTFE